MCPVPISLTGDHMDVHIARHARWMTQRGLAATTIADRTYLLARLEGWLERPLLDATAAELAGWRASMTHAPGVICQYASHAFQFYAWAVAEGLIDVNPAAGLPLPRRPRRLPRPINEDALDLAVTTAPGRIRPWLVLAGWAGLRAVEIAGLRRENVLDSIAQPVLLVTAESTKGGRHERIVPLS